MCGCHSLGSIGREDTVFFLESPQSILNTNDGLVGKVPIACDDGIAPSKRRRVKARSAERAVASEVTMNMIAERVERAVTFEDGCNGMDPRGTLRASRSERQPRRPTRG